MSVEEDDPFSVWYPKSNWFLEESLCEAAAKNNLNQMRRILQERVDANYLNGFGLSPMHIAAKYGNFEVMKMLICNECEVDIQNKSGVTPLHLAARGDHLRCAQLLCLAGAMPNKKCWTLCTPREFAPKGSGTRNLLEKCEQGFMPNPEEVFEMDTERLVPKWSIPIDPEKEAQRRMALRMAIKTSPKKKK